MRLSAISSHGFAAAAASLAALACAADSLVLPSEGAPASIEILDGNQQHGTAGSPLGDSLAIRVVDGEGRPVVSTAVTFQLQQGGQVIPATVTTDSNGEAQFRWVLGSPAGQQTLAVGIGPASQLSPKATFTAMAQPASAAELRLVRGDGQTAQSNRAVPDSLVVLLLDQFGNPVGGQDVVWNVSDGQLDRRTVSTASDGIAAVVWTLGLGVGEQTATAAYGDVTGSPVRFTATATQGPPPRLHLAVQPSSTAISGVSLSRQPAVRLEDDLGNPVSRPGVAITAAIATGGGTLSGTTTVSTNNAGVAQFTNLAISGSGGTRTLIFAAPGYAAVTSAAIDVSNPTPDPQQSTITASPSTIEAGTGVATITVTVRDASGNPLSGATVTVAANGNGNSLTQPAGPTGPDGVAIATFSATRSGTRTVTAKAGGVNLAGSATVEVLPGTVHPAGTQADVPDGNTFQFTTFTIFTQDAYGNRLTTGGHANLIRVTVNGKNHSTPTVVDQGDGTYTARYFPIFKGNDDVEITVSGVAIPGSPFRSRVR